MKPKHAALAPSILTSSVWTEPSDIRVVWITLLALASKGGKVTISIKKLGEIANVPKESVLQAIQIFAGKDEKSRSQDNEGKRIEVLADGFRILNFDKFNQPLRKVKEKTVGTGVSLPYSVVQAMKYDWFKNYKTEIAEIRIMRELNQLGGEDHTDLCAAFRSYMAKTPAQFFSWNKFRDTWKSFLKNDSDNFSGLFDSIVAKPSGYSPNAGSFWLLDDIRAKYGAKAALAFSYIGGSERLSKMSNQDRPFVKRNFEQFMQSAR